MELNFKSLGSKYLFLMKLIFEPIALVRSARSAPPGPDRTEFAHLAPDRTDRTEPTGPTGPTGPTRLDRRTGPWPGPRPGPVPPLAEIQDDLGNKIHVQ